MINLTNYNFLYPYKNYQNHKKSYSLSFQDLFVLTMLNGQEGGTYLEIGASYPDTNNNTFLISNEFFWKGVSIEISPEYINLWNNIRPTDTFICGDALQLNYKEILSTNYKSSIIDYLQLDIEPSTNTFSALKKLPLDQYRFKVISFETDYYTGGESINVRKESRELLKSLGYELIIGDVIAEGYGEYEDWWVDLNYVNKDIAMHIKNRALTIHDPSKLLLY